MLGSRCVCADHREPAWKRKVRVGGNGGTRAGQEWCKHPEPTMTREAGAGGLLL